MTVLINNGFLELSDGIDTMLLFFKVCLATFMFKPTIKHYSGDSHIGYSLSKRWLEWKIENLILENHSDFSTFVDTIKDWQAADPFTLKVKRSAGSYIEFDGDNTSFTVMVQQPGLQQMEKKSPGSQDGPYYIKFIKFEQAG